MSSQKLKIQGLLAKKKKKDFTSFCSSNASAASTKFITHSVFGVISQFLVKDCLDFYSCCSDMPACPVIWAGHACMYSKQRCNACAVTIAVNVYLPGMSSNSCHALFKVTKAGLEHY